MADATVATIPARSQAVHAGIERIQDLYYRTDHVQRGVPNPTLEFQPDVVERVESSKREEFLEIISTTNRVFADLNSKELYYMVHLLCGLTPDKSRSNPAEKAFIFLVVGFLAVEQRMASKNQFAIFGLAERLLQLNPFFLHLDTMA